MDLTPPFVLLDDARSAGAKSARLYVDPVEVVTTRKPGEVAAALEALRTATCGGLHAAGFITYEAGFALEPRHAALPSPALDVPLLWFGLFRGYREIAPGEVAALLPDPAGGWLGEPQPDLNQAEYIAKVAAIRTAITAGDLYQSNLTFRTTVATAGHPLALYAGMRERSSAGYGAVVATGTHWLLSLSPELFFSIADGAINTRPMKGTAARQADPAADARAAAALTQSEKQRAENLMIVDLLRNDLSRVAVPGSVRVPALFSIESYPTVHQLTSTVTAKLAPAHDAVDALATLFPCGSVTGAPKIAAMNAIRTNEDTPRGVYCGAIGRIDAGGTDAAFNVAIRTLVLRAGESEAQLGLGSGIVADSSPVDEWRECLAKGAFVATLRRFDLIETMRFTPDTGLERVDRHLARMARSAAFFGFRCDRHAIRNELQAATFRLREPKRVRLMLAASGAVAVEIRALPAQPRGPVTVAVAPLPVMRDDFRLRHKTTDRAFYDAARGAAFEVVLIHDDRVTEGSFTNVFIEREGVLLTPPLGPLLGGVLRAELIDEGRAVEADLTMADFADGFLLGNSLRGMLPARLAGV